MFRALCSLRSLSVSRWRNRDFSQSCQVTLPRCQLSCQLIGKMVWKMDSDHPSFSPSYYPYSLLLYACLSFCPLPSFLPLSATGTAETPIPPHVHLHWLVFSDSSEQNFSCFSDHIALITLSRTIMWQSALYHKILLSC